jgi:hypothetical protein
MHPLVAWTLARKRGTSTLEAIRINSEARAVFLNREVTDS